MARNWTEQRLQNFITSESEESLTLEFKAAEALGKSEYQKHEITKDVSAMANSAGGLLVYGIGEHSQPDKRHLPERITPINRMELPREWLEQVINTIRPRIDGILIHSISLESGENDVVYVVEIPQSHTAHQAGNHKYYKRFNFQSVPMEDYEVRDVLYREQMPDVNIRFLIEAKDLSEEGENLIGTEYNLIVQAKNNGSAYARYVACFVDVPVKSLVSIENKMSIKDGGKYYRHRLTNLNQEFADDVFKANFPLLRSMMMSWKIPLLANYAELDNWTIKWKAYADNALPKEGRIRFGEIEIVDLRSRLNRP